MAGVKQIVIKISEFLSHLNFDEILEQEKKIIDGQENSIEICFDFTETKWISPLGCLLFAKVLYSFQCNDYKCTYIYDGVKEGREVELLEWYLEIMGLKKSFRKLPYEKGLEEFRVPIQICYNPKKSLDAVNKIMKLIQKNIETSEPVLRALNWMFGEINDNAIVHGYKDTKWKSDFPHPIMLCAIAYKDNVEIAILDMGQGIWKSFLSSDKEEYNDISNEKSLQLAIEKEISTHPEGSPGFGLYGCAEITRQSKGKLVIISNKNTLILEGLDYKIKPCFNYEGTMIMLKLSKNIDIDLENILGVGLPSVVEDINDLIGDFDG